MRIVYTYKNIILGSLIIIPGTIMYFTPMILIGMLTKEVMKDIRAKQIDSEIAIHFDNMCTESFYDQRTELYFRSSLTKEESTIEMSKRWVQDGKWDECKRV
jgi:hypothetical protein